MDDMLHEDLVLVLKQNNTPMMTLSSFIFERTSSSSWKEHESLRGKQQQQNIRLCCLKLKGLHLNLVGSLNVEAGSLIWDALEALSDLKDVFPAELQERVWKLGSRGVVLPDEGIKECWPGFFWSMLRSS